MRVVPAPTMSWPSSRSRRRSSVSRMPSRMAMLLRQRGRTGSSELMMAENHNAFDPSSRFIRTCQQLRLAAILFELAVIPFLAAFHPEATRSQLVAVYVCELLFCADIYVQLNTGYYENGNVLRDARKARRKYLSSPAFLADLLALAPLSVVLPSSTTGSRSIALLEMHKLVRMWRLPALASNLDDLYARHFTSLKLTKVLGFTLMLTHFVACGRFSFGYDHPASGEEPNHWLPHAPHDGHHTIRRQYLMSLFWAFGLLTGGFEGELPRYNAEFAFTIVVGLCGFTLFTSLCATFFLLSKCESGDAELAEARVHQFQHILAFHRVPVQLQAQAVDYLQRYHTQAEANDREAARRLCPSISVDIQVELLEATVALVPVFAGCDSLFIRAVTRLLELVALPARVALFRAGDHGDAMYIVHTGVLHTVVGGVKVRELRKGSFVALNIMTDFVLWINVYGSLHLSFSVNSEKILEPTRTAERYMSSGKLFLDLCCSWPYWIFLPAKFTHPALRLPRLIGGYRLRGYVSEAEAYFRLTSRHKLMLLGVLFVMLYHIVACLYFSTTYIDGFSSGENQWLPSEDVYLLRLNTTHFGTISGTALPADSTQVQEIRAEQYFRSLYYAANVLAAVGRMVEPTSDTEYGAALIFMLSGFFITAIVVDHVQKGFTASALEQKEFFAARARFQRFLKRQNAPFSIHLRVNSFLDFWWSAHRGAIIDELLEDLPAAIKRDVVRSICTPAMDSLEMLCATTSNPEHEGATPVEESSGPTILEQLEDIFLDNIKFVLYGQGEIIYRRGDYASGLFFLLEGKVSITLNGEVPRHVPLGGFFGTAALQSTGARDRRESRRRSSVRSSIGVGYAERVTAVSGCIVVYISREHLQAMHCVLPTLPECLRKLEQRLHDSRVARSADLRAFQPRVALGLNNPTMRRALRRKQLTGLVQLLAKNLEWWQRGTAVDPDWPFVGVWEATMLMASTLQGTLVMFYICFGVNESSHGRAFADGVLVTLELLFVLDAYLHLRLGFYEYGNKVMDLVVIQGRYLRSVYFAIDMAALLPLFILNWTLTSPRLEVLNINKMLRYFKGSSQFRTLETKYVKLTTELRLLKLVYYSFLASHMFGCIWFDFAAHRSGVHIVMSGGNDWLPNFGSSLWVPYQSLESAARGLQYLASIFWSYGLMSNSSQGELPKTVGECIFSVVVMTTGFFLFAYVVGHISDVIELQDSENRHFVAKLSSLRQLLRHFDLPPRVEEKFKEYFFFKRFHSITQEHVLERVLPPSLVVDMRMFQLQPMIVKVAFLVGMEDSVTRMLVSLFTQVLFVKDEFICHFGEEGSEMFFIYTGVLDIYIPLLPHAGATSAGGAVVFPTAPSGARVSLSGLRKVNEITAGSYFGEAALFTNTPRNAFVKANTSCILYKLSRHSLELVFVRYPEWQQKVLRIVKIQQQQQRLQRLAYEAQAPDGGPSNRRRGLRRTASRMDLVNARAENIEQLLLSHRKGPNSTDDAPRRLRTWIIQQWRKLQAATLVVRWVVPALRSLQAIAKQLAHGAEIQSPFYLQWMRLVSICTVYVAVLVPYRLTYDSLDRWNVIPVCLRIGEALCEVVFWLDIWFQFHMRANQAAMELYEQDQLVGYKRERLALDLAATFPLDHFATSFSSGPSRLSLCKWLRLNRCLKVANVVYYRNEITRRSVSYEVNRAQTLWLLYLLAMFWTSCAYFAVSIYDGFGTEWQNWLPSSVLDSDDPSPELLMLRLFRGLAFAVTAFVKKSRTFVPASQLNFAFTIVISFIGQLIMALMIAEMANVFLLYIDNEVQFRKNHLIVERSLTRWKVSTALKQRADNFLTSWWSSHAGVDYQLIFEDLPASVRTEGIMVIAKQPLSLFMYRVFRPLIRGGVHSDGDVDSGNGNKGEDKTEEKGEGAEEAEKPDYGVTFHLANLTYSIAKCLRFEGYPRGEAVIVEGSVCKTMYFVVRGSLLSKSVSNPLMYPASRYRGGDYFGEIGLLGHSVSLMTVTSIRACDLFVLKSEHLLQVLKSHPYFSLVLATAQLAVQQKKSTTEFVTEWFNSNDDDGEEIESSDSSENDSDDGEEEDEDEVDEASANGGIVTEDTTLRRRSQQLRRALRGASPEVMEAWEDTFELFMEMLVPKGSISTT
ncbi:hypothetical protein PF008_g18175 [Phytophthora fragariae]|uniref:Cyclic nucleotide-binding domain-containing protein n=1 Tax=Phytophthora fragariae TaxID=53985 RepID=A0A6G0R695_9STRA|nr:hypothetical protein PF008_g18175 [Phytophthora fragariae]